MKDLIQAHNGELVSPPCNIGSFEIDIQKLRMDFKKEGIKCFGYKDCKSIAKVAGMCNDKNVK